MTTEEQLARLLRDCAEWHRRESKRHKGHRLFMESCNLGPPYPRDYERQHAAFARACAAGSKKL